MANAIDVINKFLEQPEKILESSGFGEEYYFQYGQHFFSVARRTRDLQKFGEFTFYVYPNWKKSIKELVADLQGFSSQEIPMVSYHVADYPEMRHLVVRLYKMLEEKSHKVDKIFDDILSE